MESRKILIFPLPLVWYMSEFLFDRLVKQRLTPIIWLGDPELISEVVVGAFPAMF